MVTSTRSEAFQLRVFGERERPFPTLAQSLLPRANRPPADNVKSPRMLYTITCRDCSTLFSDMALQGCLVTALVAAYSAPFVTRNVDRLSEEVYYTTQCFCQRADLGCVTCGNIVGYLVVNVCTACSRAVHDGNRFIFHPRNVNAMARSEIRRKLVIDAPAR